MILYYSKKDRKLFIRVSDIEKITTVELFIQSLRKHSDYLKNAIRKDNIDVFSYAHAYNKYNSCRVFYCVTDIIPEGAIIIVDSVMTYIENPVH